ncbi:hypothetical protein GCM10022221_13220 [Actinocorallia aurea]
MPSIGSGTPVDYPAFANLGNLCNKKGLKLAGVVKVAAIAPLKIEPASKKFYRVFRKGVAMLSVDESFVLLVQGPRVLIYMPGKISEKQMPLVYEEGANHWEV